MKRTRRGVVVLLAAAGALAVLAAGCSSGAQPSDAPAAGAAKTGKLTIALLQKQGDQQYFVDEATGAKEQAKKLGDVDVKVVDLGTDANKAISELDNVIAQKVDGIAIVVPDQKIGPQVVDAAKAANIPLVAADDAISSGDGKPAPFVGFDGRGMGQEVGKKAAELYKAAGWTAADTRIVAGWKQDLKTCSDRVEGAAEAFKTGIGAGEIPKTIALGTDNSAADALNKAGAALTDNLGVKHWIAWGCNDENETGIVTALQNGKVAPADIIGVGLGAYLTCKDWNAGQSTGNKAALYIGGPAVGSAAVDVLVGHLRDQKPLPPSTIAKTEIVDAKTWKSSGLVCT
ncbi:L-arabinose transport system substrate-binding protein [Kribbella aluminosa]|uniref:L-arabinose transport system substrate-binding protein n=1 Tax=Kribbella aluminosa TaxID=416017 RepID=A0ABS4UX19_9ACTN|nr:substrate-binding domain-containing protein [Kribbella aluminosa]MBP2356176.1 L-arabinose transport system substrate-binding protein [Kribbella aluminosa]